jgi:hypothetical protein
LQFAREVRTHSAWDDPADIIRRPRFAGERLSELQAPRSYRLLDDGGFAGFPIVLHLADHDPNGIDMTRDVVERLARYARADIEVRRIALTIEQVRRYNPPPNFAKEGDERRT